MKIYQELRLDNISCMQSNHHRIKNEPHQKLLILLIFPVFAIKNIPGYFNSSIENYIKSRKDSLYRFKTNSEIPWRKILYLVTKRLIGTIAEKAGTDDSSPRCLIIDDSDLPKTGLHIEHVGKIFSHTLKRSILGFKLLMLGYWDGKNFMGVDFSLHKEKGKNKKRSYGVKPSQINDQYSKERSPCSSGYYREKEPFTSKIDNAISMIKRAVHKGIMPDYILMDSWYFCEKFTRTIECFSRKVYIVAMGKMGTSKYEYQGKRYTTKELTHHLQRNKKQKYYRNMNVYVWQAVVKFKGCKLKLFFHKSSKRSHYHLLLTNKTQLTFSKALKIYSIRWNIEMFFKEAKQHFELGKRQSHDFDVQIADISISIMQ